MEALTNPQETIAIVGMAGRFPQAPDIETFWQNLRQGVEGITFFSDAELLARGVPAAYLQAPNFIKASPVLSDIDTFDAAFFGYAPSEAQLLDPQQRLFLEVAWHALEHAGIDPSTYPGAIGVFGGMSLSTYLLFNVLRHPHYSDQDHGLEVMISNDKDFLCTRVAYHFNLHGPALDIQTGCSTSLVATHLACEALLSLQCDVALAGGVSVNVPQRSGYFYVEGSITSPDGHCRAFDAQGQGTLFGSGVGIVVLKRLDDALRDGDTIHALILSSAINNDGAQKVGYTAPSVDGQAEVITRALALANVSADTISYVEAHGTATALGDPIEIAALSRAFRADTDAQQFCAIGSVKTNIGHLDAAAGIAGLIKTALALKHHELPPSLHFSAPNPQIDFASSPFYVNTSCQPWVQHGGPRRAGVSSFGIGGTNAHAVLQEAPALPPSSPPQRKQRIMLLSARSESALEAATQRLHSYLTQHPNANLDDVAYTLQVGRKRFAWRRAFICQDSEEARTLLSTLPADTVCTLHQEQIDRPVVFMFPGGGAQYVNMAREIYSSEPVFCEAVDTCAAMLQPQLGYDLRTALYPEQVEAHQSERLKATSLALPALFTIEYALAQLLMSWDITPRALIGHSLGEYVAACLAGVMTLEDALATVVVRGRLFEQLPAGSMLSVLAPADAIRPLLNTDLSFAAINSPLQCVVSGPTPAIEQFAALLSAREIDYQHIKINTAGHSVLVEQIVPQFTAWMATIALQPPQLPFISNVTGTWITDEQATDPAYWGQHLRQTVQFQSGVAELLAEPGYVFLELGPGNTLSTLVKAQAARQRHSDILTTVAHPHQAGAADAFVLTTLSRLWAVGVTPNWQSFYADEQRRRIPLPGYPFERQSYWIDPPTQVQEQPLRGKQANPTDWFYTTAWVQTPPRLWNTQQLVRPDCWLLFVNDDELSRELTRVLEAHGQTVIRVAAGTGFGADGKQYTIQPSHTADYATLLQQMQQQDLRPSYVIHLWGMRDVPDFSTAQHYGYNTLIHLARAWHAAEWHTPVSWWVVGQQMYRVESSDSVNPNYAINAAPCRVIPQEYHYVTCYTVDVRVALPQTVQYLLGDILAAPEERVIAYRGRQRWRQTFEALPLVAEDAPFYPLRHAGIYLITGGLGKVGLQWASYLAQNYQAKLVLVGRSPLPARDSWAQYSDTDSSLSHTIRQLQAIEAVGGELLILSADVGSETQLRMAIEQAQQRFGRIHGIIHAAGVAGGRAIKLLADFEPSPHETQFVPKVYGTYNLSRIVPDLNLDFVLLVSSGVALFGGVGLTTYAAANAFLDAFVASPLAQGTRWLSINLEYLGGNSSRDVATYVDQYALNPQESVEVFRRVVTQAPCAQVIVSTAHLPTRWKTWVVQAGKNDAAHAALHTAVELHPRPKLDTVYAPPTTAHEQIIAEIWQQILGIEAIGIDDNFFLLGGDSLMAVRATSKLKKALQIDVPIASLYEGLTVRSFAAIIERLEQEQRGNAPPANGEQRQQRHTERQERLQQQRARRQK